MNLPPEVATLYRRWLTAFPIPHGQAGADIEEQARQWATRFAQQVKFSTGDQSWGSKRAGDGRPLSKDTIAKFTNGQLLIWDLISGAGTGNGQPVNPDTVQSQDITGQKFEPVDAVDYLGEAGAGGGDDGEPEPNAILGLVLGRLVKLDETLATIRDQKYTGKLFGYTITLEPVPKK